MNTTFTCVYVCVCVCTYVLVDEGIERKSKFQCMTIMVLEIFKKEGLKTYR